MAFPGDRAIVQFARATADLFTAAVLEEGEIAILLDFDDVSNFQIRVGDGTTPGGIAFATKEYVDVVAGNSGVQTGDDATALAGTDTAQRSWPATAFAQYAKQNNALLSGTPTLETAPPNGDASLRLASTGWVANNFAKLGYLGSTQDETDFPVGHRILANANGNGSARNQLPGATLRISNDNVYEYKLGGGGTALAGTWRARGRILVPSSDNFYMYERVL